MGKHIVVVIFLCIAMISISTFSKVEIDNSLTWESVQADIKKLSRNSFYEKYKKYLGETPFTTDEKGELLSFDEVISQLSGVEKIFYSKGYSQWKDVKSMKDEFRSLYESSSGAYSVLNKRVYDLNLSIFNDSNFNSNLKGQINDKLSFFLKRIEKHFKAQTIIPSQAEMVAALGQKINAREVVKATHNTFIPSFMRKLVRVAKRNKLAMAIAGVISFILIGLRVRLKKKINKIKEREEREENHSILGEGLQRTGVVKVNGRGQVESLNMRAAGLFNGLVRVGDEWDRFFQESFYRGKKHLGVKGFYRYAHNAKVVFYINGHLDKVSQVRTIEVSQMPVKDFDNALTLMERSAIRVDSMELLDSVFSELINLKKVNLSLDVFNLIHFGRGADFLYLSEFEGKKFIAQVFKLIDVFSQFKNQGELSQINIDREGTDFIIRATLSHCFLNESDLKEEVIFEREKRSIHSILDSFQNLSQSYESSLIVKNLTINGERKVELKFKIQDNAKYQSTHSAKGIKSYAHA